MERRQFLGLAGLIPLPASLLAKTKAHPLTPPQAEGPFYPVNPIPIRSELINNIDQLEGEAMQLTGRVINQQEQAIPNARVEIWQCDGKGLYDHPRQRNTEKFDKHFAGCGAAITDSQGQYQFRTLYPVPYTGRPPHIHAKVWQGDRALLTTQLYLQGQADSNEWFNVGREHLQITPERNEQGEWEANFEFSVVL